LKKSIEKIKNTFDKNRKSKKPIEQIKKTNEKIEEKQRKQMKK
jgi:hypothetical protein